MPYGYTRQQLAAITRGENPDAPPDTPADHATLDDVLSHVKWDLSDRSRTIVQTVLDRTQPPAETARTVAMALAGLEYERDAARTEKQQITDRHAAQEAPTRAMVARLWKLYDRKRRTLPMQALRDALEGVGC